MPSVWLINCKANRDLLRTCDSCSKEQNSVPHTNNWTKLTLPKELTSSLWTGAITTASWAEDGTLKSITVFRGPYEPAIIIGPPDATPITLNLTSNDGHPSFYASAGSGIYTLILTYK